jgi:Spy/CpxP family protein refolding chaperone
MTAPTVFGLTAALLLGATASAPADGPVPQALRSFKPYQVVEQIMVQREVLSLTDQQFARLDDLTIAIRTEKHSFTHQGGKPHSTQHVPMITRQQAYDEALAVLTPDQQAQLESLYLIPVTAERAPHKLITPHGKP